MKLKKALFLVLFLFALILLMPAMAQDPAPVASPAVTAVTNPLQSVIDGLLGKYGWLATVIMVIGTLRIVAKPIMMAIENAVANDPEKLAKLQGFEAGPIFKTISFILDMGASIKLPATLALKK